MLPRSLFFAAIALLMLAELWFSNLGSLTNNLEGTAALMGLTVAAERNRLLILIALDALAAIGALLALIGCLLDRIALRRVGAMIAALGLLLYGLYQLGAALTQLPPELRATIALIGVIYMGIGVVTWVVGTRPTPDVHPSS
jgi:hypothetical protein